MGNKDRCRQSDVGEAKMRHVFDFTFLIEKRYLFIRALFPVIQKAHWDDR